MPRKLALLALVLFAFTALARTRAASHPAPVAGSGTVHGTVSRVTGNLIEIADGAVVIDATGAKIMMRRGTEATAADIKPGMQLFAAVNGANASAQGALPATLITISEPADLTLSGPIDSVDRAARTFVLLGETIHVDNQTSFGGIKRGSPTTFDDLQPNLLANVQADHVNGRLVAREVLVIAPIPVHVHHMRGTVKSIGTDSWTIDGTTFVVNAQTKIAGSPKVGDAVEVLYTVDTANNKVAVSIIKFERLEPPKMASFRGTVRTIGATSWTVRVDNTDRTFIVNERTRIVPGIKVGDTVGVTAIENSDGTHTAIAIMPLRL